jgi:hypothetical protein
MNLYIRLKNGQPFEHPILEDNFRAAFPHVDLNNLPDWVAKFERIPQPTPGVYEVYEGVTYERDGDTFKDVHHVRAMTAEEKTAKQNEIKSAWVEYPGWASWTFDEETCSFKPPVSRPTDGKPYQWDEQTVSWVEIKPE